MDGGVSFVVERAAADAVDHPLVLVTVNIMYDRT